MVNFDLKNTVIESKKFQQVSDKIQSYINDKALSCIIGLVVKDNKIRYLDKFGYNNVKNESSIEFDSIFRIYSMTKPIVSVAALQLWEKGKFKLQDPVSNYIPKFKDLKVFVSEKDGKIEVEDLNREINIIDIFTHTAGFSYGFDPNSKIDALYNKVWVQTINKSSAEIIDLFLDIPLKFQPKTQWHYSIATDILGYLIEIISGKKLDVYLKVNIFDKLNMPDTDFYVAKEKLDRFVTTYTHKDGQLIELHNLGIDNYTKPVKFHSGGSGLVSTLRDYLNFSTMLLNKGILNGKRILKKETVELMTKNHLSDNIPPLELLGNYERLKGERFGLNVSVKVQENANRESIGTFGWNGAALTYFRIDVDKGIVFIFLSQFMPESERLSFKNKFFELCYIALH